MVSVCSTSWTTLEPIFRIVRIFMFLISENKKLFNHRVEHYRYEQNNKNEDELVAERHPIWNSRHSYIVLQ